MLSKVNIYVKSTFFYIIGNGVGQGLILLSTMIFTRIMSKTDYGLYSTYYSAVSLMTTLVGANLYHALNNAYFDYKKEIHRFRASNLFLSTLVFLIISAICLLLNFITGKIFSYFIVVFALLHAFSFFLITYFNNSANMENRYLIKTVLLVVPNVFQILLSIVFILTMPTSGLNARVLGSTLGVAVCAVAAYIIMVKGQRNLVNTEYWKYALKISVPSIMSSISWMIICQSDNMMITAIKGADETAVYALIYYIGYIIYAIVQAIDGVVRIWLFNTLGKGDVKNVRLIQKWYLIFFIIIALLLLMVSPEIIKILSPESYWNFNYVGPFVIGSFIIAMSNLYGNEGLYYKKTGQMAVCSVIAAAINLILNYIFINSFGGIGAAVATAISFFVLFSGGMICERTRYRNLFCKLYFIFSLLFVIAACIIFEFVYNLIILRFAVYLIILALLVVYALFKRKEWYMIITKK